MNQVQHLRPAPLSEKPPWPPRVRKIPPRSALRLSELRYLRLKLWRESDNFSSSHSTHTHAQSKWYPRRITKHVRAEKDRRINLKWRCRCSHHRSRDCALLSIQALERWRQWLPVHSTEAGGHAEPTGPAPEGNQRLDQDCWWRRLWPPGSLVRVFQKTWISAFSYGSHSNVCRIVCAKQNMSVGHMRPRRANI